jgi:alpha-beta hydrolase superfamily lysophospholipase
MPEALTWVVQSPGLSLALSLLALVLFVNLLAYRHAYAITHFARSPGPVSPLRRALLLLRGVAHLRPASSATPGDTGLPSTTHTFTGAAGPLEGWHVPHPRGAGLVLLFHGYRSCKAELLPEARAFHELGYDTFLVDFRGSGGSGGTRTTIGYREASDVARAADYARRRWPGVPLLLYGQSMGAAAVLRALAVEGVRADAAVLASPFGRLLHTVQARFRERGVPPFPYVHLVIFWGGWLHRFDGFAHNPEGYARRVTCPTLLLHGSADPQVSCAQLQVVHDSLGGYKRLHLFDGLGHESFVKKCSDEWKAVVGRFLQERLGGATRDPLAA